MKFTALRQIYGDYGKDGAPMMVPAGSTFDAPPHLLKRLQVLEAKGIVTRYRPPVDRKAFTVYQNKMLTPDANKDSKPVVPPVRSR